MDELNFLNAEEGDVEVNLTPLIDVIFMLLLFFILAATFSQPVLEVMLPAAQTAQRTPSDTERILLAIHASGTLYHRDTPLRFDELPVLLSAQPEAPVELRVDRAAPFDAFVHTMDQLRTCGKTNVFIAATND